MQLSPAQTQNTCYGSTAKLNWGSLEQAKKMVKKMDNQSNMAVMTPFCPGFKLTKCINSIAKHHMLLSHQSETVSHSLLWPISPTAELILPYTTTVHTLNHTGTSNKKKKKKNQDDTTAYCLPSHTDRIAMNSFMNYENCNRNIFTHTE